MMTAENASEPFGREIERLRRETPTAVRQAVARLVAEQAAMLADVFYTTMFADPKAATLMDHELVNARLHASMRHWLRSIYDDASDVATLAALQVRTGEVHARIGVPASLVGRGSRVITRALCEQLAHSALDRQALVQAFQYVHDMAAAAIDAMGSAYERSAQRLVRSQEAYRLFFIGQDMKAERERRRSELLEWAHQILDRYYWDEAPTPGGEPHSAFALWLMHKASMLFDGAPELGLIRREIDRVESELLPQLARVRAHHSDARSVVATINDRITEIKNLLGAMFDRYLAIEDGRDPVTALLNRRYFPAIARREIEMAQSQQTRFALIMAGLDDWRRSPPGIDDGNRWLSQVARELQEHVRAGDFVFRIGDLDFLVLLVETDEAGALRVAEGLRRRVEALSGPGPETATPTLSAGVALFDGHPDYQRLLDRADAALRQAQRQGGNRCLLDA